MNLPQPRIRTLIVDDDGVVRAGLRMILETQSDIDVVGEAEDGLDAVAQARALHPDVVLMDIRMRGLDGIEATRRLTTTENAQAGGPGTPKVLILTTFDLDEYVYEALRAGASGFLLKRTRPEDLIAGLRVVADGDALLAPSVTRRLIDEFTRAGRAPRQATTALEVLTGRERQVLALVGSGLSNAEIAGSLCVSEATVKSHIKRIFRKLEITDRAKAVVVSYETGLVQPSR